MLSTSLSSTPPQVPVPWGGGYMNLVSSLLFLPPAPSDVSSSSLSTQVEPSVPNRTGTRPKQVRRHGKEARHFQDQHSFMEAGILIWIPDAPQASPIQAGMYHVPVSIQGSTHKALVDSRPPPRDDPIIGPQKLSVNVIPVIPLPLIEDPLKELAWTSSGH